MNRKAWLLWVVTAVLSFQPATWAQVTQLPVGQALDANPQMGSGGYNTVVGGYGGVNPQLVVTGQVSGLAYFHGTTLIAANQLRIVPPSATFDTFLRQSVGVGQSINYGAYATVPFYSPASTIYDVPGARINVTPSTNTVPINAAGVETIQRAYKEAQQQYQLLMPLNNPTNMEQAMPRQVELRVDLISKPGAAAVFGIPEQSRREALARELQEAGNLSEQLRQANPNQLDQRYDPAQRTENGPPVGGQETLGGAQGQELAASTRGGARNIPQVNQDVYIDLLMAMREQREEKQPPIAGQPRVKRPVKPGEAIVETKDNQVVLHGLAGRSNDMFNQYMSQGQSGLKVGKYYEAARNFEQASIINTTNPMARVGQGVALLGAGEYYTAGAQFRRAMEIFPPLMETHLDLAAMMSKDDLAKLVEDVTKRALEDDPGNTLLVFLAAYLNYNQSIDNPRQGYDTTAKNFAKKLETRTDASPVMRTFAIYVQTGKIPKELPALAPTSRPVTTTRPATDRPVSGLPDLPQPMRPTGAPVK